MEWNQTEKGIKIVELHMKANVEKKKAPRKTENHHTERSKPLCYSSPGFITLNKTMKIELFNLLSAMLAQGTG